MQKVDVMNKDEIHNIVSESLDQDARNIKRELYRRALSQTCDYIEKNMFLVNSNFKNRYELLDDAIKNATIKDGLWLEFGVYKGETIRYIADKTKTIVYGFDSFKGNPDDWRSEHRKGEFALRQMPSFPRNIKVVTGWFKDSLPKFLAAHNEPVSFIHIDCDLYSSTKTVLHQLKDRLIKGSIIVFDEFFNYPGWKQHEFKAFTEFIKRTNIRYEYIGYVYKHSQVSIKIRSNQNSVGR
jgi:hypothetical protein